MAKRAKIEELPEDVRHWLERALTESGFSGYEQLETLLRDKGFEIGKSSIHRYGQKIERRFAAIKASTEAARILTEGAADDQDARSGAIIALIQSELFESIINMQEAEEGADAGERLGILSAAAKNVATLTRASVALKRFQSEVRAKVQAAADSVAAVAKKGGLTTDAVESIRREILGIAQ
jgi:hypothetical protein